MIGVVGTHFDLRVSLGYYIYNVSDAQLLRLILDDIGSLSAQFYNLNTLETYVFPAIEYNPFDDIKLEFFDFDDSCFVFVDKYYARALVSFKDGRVLTVYLPCNMPPSSHDLKFVYTNTEYGNLQVEIYDFKTLTIKASTIDCNDISFNDYYFSIMYKGKLYTFTNTSNKMRSPQLSVVIFDLEANTASVVSFAFEHPLKGSFPIAMKGGIFLPCRRTGCLYLDINNMKLYTFPVDSGVQDETSSFEIYDRLEGYFILRKTENLSFFYPNFYSRKIHPAYRSRCFSIDSLKPLLKVYLLPDKSNVDNSVLVLDGLYNRLKYKKFHARDTMAAFHHDEKFQIRTLRMNF